MKILMIVPSFCRTGPIYVALNIIKNFKFIAVDVLVLKNGVMYDEFDKYSQNIYVLNYIDAVGFLVKNNRKYDVVHSHCVIPDLFNAILVSNKYTNKITTLHNYIDIDYVNESGRVKGNIISILHKFALRKIGKVVSCSESVSIFIRNKYNINSCFVRNGVEKSISNKKKSEDIERYIIVGVFNKRKNHSVAIDGFVNANKDNSELLVLGDGPLFNKVSSKYANASNVKFLGNTPNVRDYLSISDVYLSSSLAEGLPMALLEALSEGLTYIISDIGPHQEISQLEEGTGIVSSNSQAAFSKSILSLDSKSIARMKNMSLKMYINSLTDEVMSDKYVELYSCFGERQ